MKTTLVTCSYGPDLTRCQVLCQSVDEYVDSQIEHVVIVPRRDVKQFEPMVNARRRLVRAEDVLPRWLVHMPLNPRWWLSPYSMPVRGWIVQQITKLSIPLVTDAQALVFADSDLTFIRPFSAEQVWSGDTGNRVRLYHAPGQANQPSHRRWHRKAGQLLGLEPRDYYGSDYIGHLITWRRDHLLQLHERLESVNGKDWRLVLCRTLHFSEYILYGVFIDHVLKDQHQHEPSTLDLCHCSWHYDLNDPAGYQRFIGDLQPHHVAVLVQSNLGMSPDQQRQYVQAVVEGQKRPTGQRPERSTVPQAQQDITPPTP